MGFYGTHAGIFSDLSLTLEILITIAFLLGYRFARKRDISKHYKTMTTAFVLDVVFVLSYMVKSLIEGRTGFGGPENLKILVYLPTVIFHSIISVIVLVMAGYMIYYGFKHTERFAGSRRMVDGKSRHVRLGKATIIVWILSVISGILVYLLLYVFFVPIT
jgi:putative membrane protein